MVRASPTSCSVHLGFTFTASCSGLSGFPCRNSDTLPHIAGVTPWNYGARFHDLLNLACFVPTKQVSCGTMLPCSSTSLRWSLGPLGPAPGTSSNSLCVLIPRNHVPLLRSREHQDQVFNDASSLTITDTLSFALPLLKLQIWVPNFTSATFSSWSL